MANKCVLVQIVASVFSHLQTITLSCQHLDSRRTETSCSDRSLESLTIGLIFQSFSLQEESRSWVFSPDCTMLSQKEELWQVP